ncbi:MAG: ABC transporter substrate-binding protein [Candidatus Paceibacterota bacterium]|jgi:branched-chain amino acid transport system substrate-binding protein
MKNKNILAAIFIIAAGLLSIGVFWGRLPGAEMENKNSIKIGAVLPLTGGSSITGEQSRQGLDLALEKINAQGGVNGRSLAILYEDSQAKTEVGLTAFLKLKSADNIKFVVTSASGVALAISPVANNNKIVQMDVVSATPKYSTPNDFTFRTGISSSYFAKKMSETMISKGADRIAILFLNNDYGLGYKEAFQSIYQKNNGQIVLAESYAMEDKDFKTQIVKIKNSKPEAILLISLQKETPIILRQMEQLGINLPIYSDIYSAELPDNLKLKIAENLIYLKPVINSGGTNAVAKEFGDNYWKKFGQEPDFVVAQGYDGLNLLTSAMRQCPQPEDTVCVKDNLYKIKNYQGVVSSSISFDLNGDIGDRPLELKTIRNGQFVKF